MKRYSTEEVISTRAVDIQCTHCGAYSHFPYSELVINKYDLLCPQCMKTLIATQGEDLLITISNVLASL